MEAKSKQTNIRVTARKMRRVANEVRGKNAQEALNMLKFMPYSAARYIEKNIVNAVANATTKWGVASEGLKVSEIYADEGPTYKRFRPRAQGRIYKIMKRTSHLTVKLSLDTKKQK